MKNGNVYIVILIAQIITNHAIQDNDFGEWFFSKANEKMLVE